MPRLHESERRQFERLFQAEDKESWDEILLVLEAFLSTEAHITLEELFGLYKSAGGNRDKRFIQEALDIMIRYGFAQKVALEGKPVSYEHRHLGNHHDHLVCVKCGRVEEFYMPELESLQDRIAYRRGFQNLQHRLEIYGLCRECAENDSEVIALSSASVGDRLMIDHVTGDKGMLFQLAAMGLQPGQEVELLSANGGPVVVARGGSRLAVGRVLSDNIMVRRSLAPGRHHHHHHDHHHLPDGGEIGEDVREAWWKRHQYWKKEKHRHHQEEAEAGKEKPKEEEG